LKSPMIIKGFEDGSGQPILEPANNHITLRRVRFYLCFIRQNKGLNLSIRQLLTH
jgi:hypothetical protein